MGEPGLLANAWWGGNPGTHGPPARGSFFSSLCFTRVTALPHNECSGDEKSHPSTRSFGIVRCPMTSSYSAATSLFYITSQIFKIDVPARRSIGQLEIGFAKLGDL